MSSRRLQVQQTPQEGQKTYQPKHCGNNNKDEDNSPKTLNDKNHQASSQKFRQQRWWLMIEDIHSDKLKTRALTEIRW